MLHLCRQQIWLVLRRDRKTEAGNLMVGEHVMITNYIDLNEKKGE